MLNKIIKMEITIDHASIFSDSIKAAPILEYMDRNKNIIPIRNDITRRLESLIHEYNTTFEYKQADPIRIANMKELEREIYDTHAQLIHQYGVRLNDSTSNHMKEYTWQR